MSEDAIRYAGEYVAFLEWHQRRTGRQIGDGIGVAAHLINKAAAGNDPWADDNDGEN
ncbi:hypothetical protein [Lentzea kentuckyensis]|uniref:hypothetical protein n=1 Tax=Lentzea kentuckyensis TaxID=360086 RepID=UPI001302CFFC|nr:hypothetical protein [Lentzea kentuckyensis]